MTFAFACFISSASAHSKAVSVVAGDSHTCALNDRGDVFCWGGNQNSCLGQGSTPVILSATPLKVNLPEASTALVGGTSFVCTLTRSGKVLCWGDNHFFQLGQVGIRESSTPVVVEIPAAVTRIMTHDLGACAWAVDGRTYCWGTVLGVFLEPSPVVMTFGSSVPPIKIDGSDAGLFVLFADGSVGLDSGGGMTTIPLSEKATEISTAPSDHCVVLASGRVLCWGGENGFSWVVPLRKPVARIMQSQKTWTSNSLTGTSIVPLRCVQYVDSAYHCWGLNTAGEIGVGVEDEIVGDQPGEIEWAYSLGAWDGMTGIQGSWNHLCGISADGSVKCVGSNDFGQLGISGAVNYGKRHGETMTAQRGVFLE